MGNQYLRNRSFCIIMLLCCAFVTTSCANLKKDQLKTSSISPEQSQKPDKHVSLGYGNANIDLSESELDHSDTNSKKEKKKNRTSWQFWKKDKTKTGSISSSQNSDDLSTSNANAFTLAFVVKQALSNNPDVIVASAQTAEALAGVKIAKTANRPSVDLSVLSGVESTYSETSKSNNIQRDEINIQVRKTLYDFGQNDLNIDRRKALLNSARNRELDTKEQIALEITEAYLDFLKQSELVDLAKENIKVHTEIAKLVRLSEQGGNSTVADVKRVETRLDSANSAKVNNENSLKDSIAAFKRLTDVEPKKIKKPRNIIPKSTSALSGVKTNSLKNNPRLKSLHLDALSLEKQLNKQTRTLYPKIYALGEANYKSNISGDTGVNKDYRAMIGMSWKLYDGGKSEHVAEQIQSRILEADAKYRKLYTELIENMENTKQELSSGSEKREFLNSSVNSARKVMSLYRKQFKAGERSAFEILDAQRDLYAAEQELKNHSYQNAAAYYRELRIAGKLVATQLELR